MMLIDRVAKLSQLARLEYEQSLRQRCTARIEESDTRAVHPFGRGFS